MSSYPEVNITDAYDVLSNWTGAVPPPIMAVNSTGEGVGAERTWMLQNLTVTETLTNETMNDTTGYLNQMWNLTMPIEASPSVVISNATSDLTLYQNSTSNDTSVQFFVNFCVSDQQAGLQLYSELATLYLTGLNSLFTGGNSTDNSTTGGAGGESSSSAASSSMMPSSSMESSSSSMMSSSATDSAASSSGTGAAASATSGASSVASAATSGAGGALSSGLSGASSLIGQITGAASPSQSAVSETLRINKMVCRGALCAPQSASRC